MINPKTEWARRWLDERVKAVIQGAGEMSPEAIAVWRIVKEDLIKEMDRVDALDSNQAIPDALSHIYQATPPRTGAT